MMRTTATTAAANTNAACGSQTGHEPLAAAVRRRQTLMGGGWASATLIQRLARTA